MWPRNFQSLNIEKNEDKKLKKKKIIVGNKKTSKQHQLFIIFNYVDKHEANREGNHLLLKLCPNFFFLFF